MESTPATLALILRDFAEAGIRPTPLAIISTATDRGLSDVQIQALCDVLASQPDLASRAA